MNGVLRRGWLSLRRMAIYAFSRVNPGDIFVGHHYTGEKFRLHSFRHKGYWYYGRRREQSSMEAFARLIRPDSCVLEAGGHIGYVSLYLASLVGERGSVHVFEPGPNNLPYIRANLAGKANMKLVPEALGSEPGRQTMYVENLTGQNNSMVPNFGGLALNEAKSIKAHIVGGPVTVNTIDSYAAQENIRLDFLKIDVEGYEWEVLRGAEWVLRQHRPTIMVEVQSHRIEIAELLRRHGYRLYQPSGAPIIDIPGGTVNVFAIPPDRDFPVR